MRIDKFLKLSKLVKRRTAAREMVEVGAVRLNGRTVKPSSDVREGDKIEVAFPRRVIAVNVLTAEEKDLKRGANPASVEVERRLAAGEKPW